MFWNYNTTSPQIDIILCKDDLTLYELLDQENVLQELKAQNLKLIEFLLKPEILKELVTLITTEPSPDVGETEQYKYPNLACELLTSDLPALNERLASEEILNKLYEFLQNESPLNPLLASYFSRTLSILISRKNEQSWYAYQYTCVQALEFLKAKENFIKLMLKHIGTSSIMDLMHNLVTLIEGAELKQSLRSWLQSQNVIPSLIGLLTCDSNPNCQVNSAAVLCSIVQKLRDNMNDSFEKPVSDPILNLLESSETIELLLSTMFDTEMMSETAVEGGIDVLLTIIQPYLPGDAHCRQALNYSVHDKVDGGMMYRNNSFSSEPVEFNESSMLPNIIKASLPFIKKLFNILKNPVKKEPIKLTSGIISPPFGKARLIVAKLITVFVSLNNHEINKEIICCDIPELLLDLFRVYSSNNFLHTEVEKLIAYAIDHASEYTTDEYNDDHQMIIYLLKKCKLIQRLLDLWHENAESEKENHYRRGYMGHLIKIVSLIYIESEKDFSFRNFLEQEIPNDTLQCWNEFVDNELKFIIEKHSMCLGGVYPKLCQTNDSSFEENISNKELKPNYKEYEVEDDINGMITDDVSNIFFKEGEYNLEENGTREGIFNAVCSMKWSSNEIGSLCYENSNNYNDFRNCLFKTKPKSDTLSNWDSDDDIVNDENIDEEPADSSDPWSKLGSPSNPWANSSNDSSGDLNWANFDDSKSIRQNNIESCLTLATNVEQYSLFGNSSNEKTNIILNNFSNVRISSSETNNLDDLSDSQFSDNYTVNGNNEWNSISNAFNNINNEICNRNDNQTDIDPSFSADFNCYELENDNEHCKNDNEYDKNEEMLNLESIHGNTLAEKIANAEYDIRNKNKNQIFNDLIEQKLATDNFQVKNDDLNEAISVKIDDDGSAYNSNANCAELYREENIEVIVNGNISESMYVAASRNKEAELLECLTENSVDFVTAENSASDAESSVEFGDAENSLELEAEEETAEYDKVEFDRSSSAKTLQNDDVNNLSKKFNEHLEQTQNVFISEAVTEKCNSLDLTKNLKNENVQKEVSTVILNSNDIPDKLCNKNSLVENASCETFVNGDANHEDDEINCDTSKNICIGFCLKKEQLEKNVNGAIIEEPA